MQPDSYDPGIMYDLLAMLHEHGSEYDKPLLKWAMNELTGAPNRHPDLVPLSDETRWRRIASAIESALDHVSRYLQYGLAKGMNT
ncbi:MAG: hypothetical protein ACPG7F_00635 [Aggregatilineales bacterium]